MRYVGQGIAPLENVRLVKGEGQYLDDLKADDVMHLGVVRSPYAHASIRKIDVSDAKRRSVIVLTPEDVKILLQGATLPADEYQGANLAKMPVLASGKVKYVGQPVAAVVVDSRYSVEDVVELVSVDYEVLEAVVDPEKALEDGAPVIHEELGSNLCLKKIVEGGDVESVFKSADLVVEDELYVSRVASNPIEPRAFMVKYGDGKFHIDVSTQSVFRLRGQLADIFRLSEENFRIFMPDVGGAFGSKTPLYPEYILACLASLILKRPVKWVESRREHLTATYHGRDVRGKISLAASRDGKILGVKAKVLADIGAYNFYVNSWYSVFVAKQLTGPYDVKAARVEALSVFTNKTPVGPYRGYGRPEAAFFYERMVDLLADELGMDPAEVRAKNLIRPESMPYFTPLGLKLDRADYPTVLDEALRHFNYEGMKNFVKKERSAGRLVGLGLSSYIELSRTSLGESALIRLRSDGKVVIASGSAPHGQGTKTALAQIAADELGIDIKDIEFYPTDSRVIPAGVGTFASRSAVAGGAAVIEACKELKQKIIEAASRILGTSVEGLRYENGLVITKSEGPSSLGLKEIASKVGELEAYIFVKGEDIFSFGTHLALVEVDKETGKVRVLNYMAVDDAGRVINPLLVEGQLAGGIMQGVGQLLYEEMVYNEEGQPLIGSIGDAGVPSIAESVERVESILMGTPSTFPHGARGIGEAGTIGSLPSITSAVEDALGRRVRDTNLKPENIWRLLLSNDSKRR